MRCELCRKSFVGDTPLCPKCEAEQIYFQTAETAMKTVKATRRYMSSLLVWYAVLSAAIITVYGVLLSLPVPSAYDVWYGVLTIVFFLFIIYFVENVFKEKRQWRVFKAILEANDRAAFEDELLKLSPTALYRIHLDGGSYRRLSYRIGVRRTVLRLYYTELDRCTESMRRHHRQNQEDTAEES